MSHPSGWACHQPSTRTPSQPPPHSIVRVLTQERTLRLGSLLPWSMKGEEKEWVQPSMDSAGKERGMTGESSFLCADCPVRGGLDPFWQFLRAADSFVRAADSSSELFREGCISNKSNGGWPRRAALRGVMVCGCVMSCHVFMVTHLIPCIRTCHVTWHFPQMAFHTQGFPMVPNGSQRITLHTLMSRRERPSSFTPSSCPSSLPTLSFRVALSLVAAALAAWVSCICPHLTLLALWDPCFGSCGDCLSRVSLESLETVLSLSWVSLEDPGVLRVPPRVPRSPQCTT